MKKAFLYNPQAVLFDMPLPLLSIAPCLDPKEFEEQVIDRPIEKNAQKRCKNDNYRLPVEKIIINKLFPRVELS